MDPVDVWMNIWMKNLVVIEVKGENPSVCEESDIVPEVVVVEKKSPKNPPSFPNLSRLSLNRIFGKINKTN